MPHALKNYFWPVFYILLGIVATAWIFPLESARVHEHFIGYPNANYLAHSLRPWLLALLSFLPAIAAILHRCSTIMDRYLTRELIRCFITCGAALFGLIMLLELQDSASDFKDTPFIEVATFYFIQLPSMFMLILPYSLMLALLWCLGKMSKSQEIVSMIQSGRSVLRIMLPLIVTGFILALATTIFSYHWAPYAEGYKSTLMRELKGEPDTAAVKVGYGHPEKGRMWYVGKFPRAFAKGAALEKVKVIQKNEEGKIAFTYIAETANWRESDRVWTLHDVIISDRFAQGTKPGMAKVKKQASLEMPWEETPWQIIRPGLLPTELGIPELHSWLENNPERPLSFRRAYQTWWHVRWAQPFICLVIVLLAAPLGIAFTRRGVGGGVAVAIFLCAGMLFFSTVFPTLGESGHLHPILAAWATNILFLSVAIILFYRRISGQPIYQTLRKFLPF